MTVTRRMAGTGLALAAAALMFGTLVSAASAQTPPFTAYGTGMEAGATVGWTLDGEICGTETVDADRQWLMPIGPTDACQVSEGDTVGFTVDGAPAAETVTFTPGGAPEDVAAGIDLTVEPEEPADPEAPVPAPAATGNAGLLAGSTGTPPSLVVLLAVASTILVVGARTATRRA